MGLSHGTPTAHSYAVMRVQFSSEQNCIWQDAGGRHFGIAIESLYKDVVKAVKTDDKLYELLALTDSIRVGRARKVSFALDVIGKTMRHD